MQKEMPLTGDPICASVLEHVNPHGDADQNLFKLTGEVANTVVPFDQAEGCAV